MSGVGGRLKKKGIYVYLQLIHTVVWEKPTQQCKATILQLNRNKKKLMSDQSNLVLKSRGFFIIINSNAYNGPQSINVEVHFDPPLSLSSSVFLSFYFFLLLLSRM